VKRGCPMRALRLALAVSMLAVAAFAHYPFVRYTTNSAPYKVAPAKFDIQSLPDGIVQYFVVGSGPDKLAAGDSFEALLAQIRAAAEAWNGVRTSELRLQFGGSLPAAATDTRTPGIQIVFAELPPGVLAMGGPDTLAEPAQRDGAEFVPISRSLLVLGKDLSNRPSHADAFYLTLVHELGHALGLQHTFTSSVMSTAATRTTTRSRPLAGDDIAGISMLYPAPGYHTRVGSIQGRVTAGGVGVHLASVVAISPSGEAVSAFTKPDGAYEITGLPPGLYYIYVHPLPPAVQSALGPGDILLPVDPDGKPVPAGPLFETVFFPNARSVSDASVLSVQPGAAVSGIDFAVNLRERLKTYGVATYGCPGAYCLQPAFVNRVSTRNYFLAWGPDLTKNGSIASGLSVETVGGATVILPEKTRVYSVADSEGKQVDFLQLYLSHHLLSGSGARHLAFRFDDDLYVLPAGVHVTDSQPPSVASAEPVQDAEGRLLAVIKGSNLAPSTRFLFNGAPAPLMNFDWDTGDMIVLPPPAKAGYRAVVTALDPGGQTSMFLDAGAPAVFEYPARPAGQIQSVSPSQLRAGTEAMIEIAGEDALGFRQGVTQLAFGSAEITVRRVWVTSPGRLIANIHVSSRATAGLLSPAVINGLARIAADHALQILPAEAGALAPDPNLVNPATGRRSVHAGGEALLTVANLDPVPASSLTVTFSGVMAEILDINPGRVLLRLPAHLPIGPAVMQIAVNGASLPPLAVQVDPPPPTILGITLPGGTPVNSENPLLPGDLLVVTVAGLCPAGESCETESIEVSIGGILYTPIWSYQVSPDSALTVLWLRVDSETATGDTIPVAVGVGERVSPTAPIAIRPAGG